MAAWGKKCVSCGRRLYSRQRTCFCGAAADAAEDTEPLFDYGAVLQWVPAAAALFLLTLQMSRDSGANAAALPLRIYALLAVACAILAVLDARRLDDRPFDLASTRFAALSPASWFVFVLFAWPVAFPVFLYTHYGVIERRRMIRGWAAGGLFAVTAAAVWAVALLSPGPLRPAAAYAESSPMDRSGTPERPLPGSFQPQRPDEHVPGPGTDLQPAAAPSPTDLAGTSSLFAVVHDFIPEEAPSAAPNQTP